MSSELGIAVWGIGRHAIRRVLPALAQSRSVDLVGICTRDDTRGRETAALYSCAYFAAPELMFADRRVEAVYVATPTGLHFVHGQRVLEAGRHLWCEKPMTNSYASTCELFALAERKGLMAASGLMYKYHPQFIAIKRLLAERTIGELKTLSIRFGMPHLGIGTFRDDPDLGGGALLDLGCYALSVAFQVLGELPELKFAHVSTPAPHGADTDGWAVLQSGSTLVDSVWGMGRAYQNSLQIWGTRGVLVADRVFTKEDDYDSTVLVFDQKGGEPTVVRSGKASGHRAMVDAFAARIGSARSSALERQEAEWCALITEQISRHSSC